ncbi:hypothetical protein NP233_g424 [Leucocoprinus birnbaumii]|uniref:Uncharacterized protein n=1 Tax=Leucocoprinus birnbaumii TaxID=56174 RepID=A0AAD5YVT2_9AGAR|nr:hypothetical protein NP233_g424 [Leucocoprinus birnbaumii]
MYIQEEDEDDICPVCDGECTCDNKPRAPPQPMSLNQYSLSYAGSSSSSTISSIPRSLPKPSPPPLKIKLTVPPNLLGNKKHTSGSTKSKNVQETTSAFAPAGETHSNTHPYSKKTITSIPKRRGRPPKAVIAAREAAKAQAAARLQSSSPPPSHFSQPFIPKNVGSSKRKKSGPTQKRGLKAKHAGHKRSLKRKRRVASDDDDESSLSNLTDADYDCDDDDDGESLKFPTFLSASALSSLESSNSSDSSSLSDSDSCSFAGDSDIEKEEENYIVSQVHEKARLRRELLGDDGHRIHNSQNDWVIRSRKKSVDPSDNEMNIDSDGTEEDDEEEEESLDEDEEETDGRVTGAGYTGLVTAWSDDEESSFDADIFFANLTDSDDNSDSSNEHDEAGDEGDQSDMDTASQSDTAELISQRQELENLQLEVTQGWDGQIVFTNGLNDGRGILDLDFEVKASQFLAEASSVPAQDSDVEMSSTHGNSSGEGGYEEDVDGGEGDTTDEDLVGEDDLPNDRAMQIFSLPFSVSAINPLSTVSPVVSPAPHRRMVSTGHGLESPKPEDILAGKVYWDSDDHDHDEEERRERSRSQGSSHSRGPRTGVFVPVQENRKAIIDGTKEVPSPHPRFNRRRSSSTATKITVVEQMLRRHLLNNNSRSTPTFTTASELLSPLQLLSSDNDFGSPSPSLPMIALSEEPEPVTESIKLDDVLDASYLAPESSETSDHSLIKRAGGSLEEDEHLSSGKHLQNLNRWDLISVGAFRQTRENGGWSSDNHPHTPHSSVDYNNIMRASPLSAIMWPKEKERQRRRTLTEPMSISPVILPVGDGDRTPTGSGGQQQNGFNHNLLKNTQKPRKESKRERKLKKKNWGPVHHQHSHHHHWHNHQHHPNSKTRGTSSNQRSFLSAVPPFNL